MKNWKKKSFNFKIILYFYLSSLLLCFIKKCLFYIKNVVFHPVHLKLTILLFEYLRSGWFRLYCLFWLWRHYPHHPRRHFRFGPIGELLPEFNVHREYQLWWHRSQSSNWEQSTLSKSICLILVIFCVALERRQ